MDVKERYRICARAADDKKADNVVILELSAISDAADYFIIASGSSDRQVRAIADGIHEKMKERRIIPAGIEGYNEGKWILMDYSDIVVHIFYEPLRELYDLERLWHDARRVRRRKAVKAL